MKKWTGITDSVDVIPFHTWKGVVGDMSSEGIPNIKRYPCSLLWYTAVINWDGKLSPCCVDYDESGDLGSINDNDLYYHWNGPKLEELRQTHILGHFEEGHLCRDCEYWRIKEDIGKWLKKKQPGAL